MARDVALWNKLAKWRTVFASWQLGTRSDTDPECKAVKDHREVTIFLRAEVNAITRVLLDRGVISESQLIQYMDEEARYLDRAYEHDWPGITTSEVGIHFSMPEAIETMKRFASP